MHFSLLAFFLASLALVRSATLETDRESFCEFFKDMEAYRSDLAQNYVNLLKSSLTEAIRDALGDPEKADYVAFLKEHSDRGDSITSASPYEEKTKYFKEFAMAARNKSIVVPDLLFKIITSTDDFKQNWKDEMKTKMERDPSRADALELFSNYTNSIRGTTTYSEGSALKHLKHRFHCDEDGVWQ